MSRRAALITALMLVLIPTGSAAARPDSAAATPSIRIADSFPLSVSGRGFKPREHVVVRTATARKAVTATAGGRFLVRFFGLKRTCSAIRAVGSQGSRATTRPPRAFCIEP